MQTLLRRIVRSFPRDGMTAAFGYGSGVFRQLPDLNTGGGGSDAAGAAGSSNMIDLIFAVDRPRDWHRANLACNPSHYSFLRFGGGGLVNAVQNHCPVGGVYYNTLVHWEDSTLIKYGVISTEALLSDLLEWRQLYVAGRLHKPVEWVVQGGASIASAQRNNLQSALAAALLLLPSTFTETELFMAVAGLSYHGDWRMIFGEDKGKIENIVSAQLHHFRLLYGPLLVESPLVDWQSRLSDLILRDNSPEATATLLYRLPHRFLERTFLHDSRQRSRPSLPLSVEDMATRLAENPAVLGGRLSAVLRSTVRASSVFQTGKGLLTAGLTKSVIYSSRKLTKMMRGLVRI